MTLRIGASRWVNLARCSVRHLPHRGGLLSALLLSVWLYTPVVLANDTLRVGVYHNPPKLLAGSQGQPSGVMGELLAAIASEQQWHLKSVPCDFADCLTLLGRGDIDILPAVAWSDERDQRFIFHREPVLHSWSQLYQREGVSVEAIQDLEGLRVAVVEGAAQQRYLTAVTERFNIPVTWVLVNSLSAGFERVANNEADLVAANAFYGDWRAPYYGVQETPVTFQPTQLFYAASHHVPSSVLGHIDNTLKKWKQERGSVYDETLRAWRIGSLPHAFVPVWLWWSLGLLMLFLVWVTGRNVLLKRRIVDNRDQLLSHEMLLSTILDSVDAYIYIKSPSLTYRFVNRRISELFGVPPEQVVGQRDEAFFDAASAAEICQVDRRVLASGEKITLEEHNLLKGDDQVRTFLTIKMPLVVRKGEAPSLCGISTELTEYLKMQSRTHNLAFYDVLTGLPNRRLLMESLVLATGEEGGPFSAVLAVDLDDFRLINDIQGHESGDQLLVNVASLLQETIETYEQDAIIARVSSDEFVLLLNELGEHEEAAALMAERTARQLLSAVSQLHNDRSLPISASIGITLFSGAGHSATSVLQQADIALHQAKAAGGNRLCFFNQDMQTHVVERASLEGDLHHALARNELALHYQVQVDHRGVTVGVEALLRWYHPQRGWVAPATFIPLVEESGLIVPIGYWVLKSACEQLAVWASQPAYSALSISVNVSAVQFQQTDFVRVVEGLLAETQAPPRRLILEVTESVLMREPTLVRRTMARLREHGIRFALDDFGTGYSSLSYLKRLPLDELKIDQSFIRELLTDNTDAAIVDTTILLAASLGLTVVAEGVEHKEQLAWLRGHGCYRYQGYLLGKPAPVEKLFDR